MLVGPAVEVFLEGGVEALGPQHVFAQHHEAVARLQVGKKPEGVVPNAVGVRHDRLVPEGRAHLLRHVLREAAHHLRRRHPALAVKVERRVLVHKGVEALVHPDPAALVGPHDHRKPGVAELVIGDLEEGAAARIDVAEHDLWVLHALDPPGHVDRVGVWVGRHEVGVKLDGVLRVRGRPLPAGVLVGAEPLFRVKRLGKYRAVPGVGLRRVPDEGTGGCPREVAHPVGLVLPGQAALPVGTGVGGTHFRAVDDHDRLTALARLGQPLALRLREHLVGVLEAPGAAHDHVARHGDVHVEGAVL